MNEPRKLSSYVEPELTGARLDAQWSRIGERLPVSNRKPRWQFAAAAGFAFAATAAVLWLQYGPARHSAWESSVVRSDEAPVELTLAEGSRVELSPRSQVEFLHSAEGSVQLRLSEGSARFSVSERAARRFSVRSGPIEVVATDTQFRIVRSLAAEGEHVRVEVQAGSADVRRRDGEATAITLVQGEHWSTFVAYEKAAPALDEVTRMKRATSARAATTDQADVPVEDDTARATSESDAREVTPEVTPEVINGQPAARRPQRGRVVQASPAHQLFDRANIARRAGQVPEAAALYAELVQRFPRDQTAALAAFELGRIRMDTLSDLRGAVQAFDQALTLDSGRAFAEDALARLALAHDKLGDAASCKRAKERYLKRYPEGVHANVLARRCP